MQPLDIAALAAGHPVPWLVLACSLVFATFLSAWNVAGLGEHDGRRPVRITGWGVTGLLWGSGLWASQQLGIAAVTPRTGIVIGLPLWPVLAAGMAAAAGNALPLSAIWRSAWAGMVALAGIAGSIVGALAPMDRALFGLLCVLAALVWLRVCMRAAHRPAGSQGGWPTWGRAATGALIAMLLSAVAGWGIQRNAGRMPMPDDDAQWSLLAAIVLPVISLALATAFAMRCYRVLGARAQREATRLGAFVENAPDGLITADREGRILTINPAALAVLNRRLDDVLGQNAGRVLAPEDASFADWLHRAPGADAAGPHDFETTAERPDGSALALRLAVSRVTPDAALDGDGPCFVIMLSDLGRRKAIENALRVSEQQARSLASNIPGVSFRSRVDARLGTLFVSPAIVELIGWPAEDFTSGRRTLGELIHPADHERVVDEMRTAIATGRSYVTEYRLMHRDGGECWVWQSGSALQGAPGDLPCIDGVMFDITEMRLRHAAFEGTVDAVHRVMGVIEFDMQGRVLSANERMLGWMGYGLDELRGMHHSELTGDAPAGRTAFDALWQRLRRGEYETGEFRRTTREGAEFWIQASYNPIFDTDGTPFKVLLLATDINARRQMERALREAKARAEQAAAAKTMFLANMSHEIRTPMNAILGFTDVLLGGPLAEEQRRHLQTVRQSARALLALLNGILDTAKLEKGALALELADFSLRELVQHTADSLRLGAQAKGLAFDVRWAPDAGDHFFGDVQRIRQVLINLLGNAIKFTGRGGVQLAVQRDGEHVHFLVSDTGIGIPSDRIAAIFDPFSQADASTSRRFGGTGLGTTIARQLVELMGGRIDVESTPDVGSTFHVRLPLQPAQASVALQGEADTTAVVPPPLDVLAVDDVAENRELVAIALGRAGHRVTTATGAADALTLFGRSHFDLVLMDLHMPGTDGLEAARSIRWLEAAGARAPTPIIALTASVLAEDRLAAQQAGMEGFSPKPIELPVLLAEMARVTGRVAEPGAVPVPIAPAASDAGLDAGAATPASVPAVVDWERGARLWTSEAELLRNLRTFLDSQSDAPQALARLLRVPDLDGARQLAHRLRGVGANLCCDALQAVAGLIETALAVRDIDAAMARLPGLAGALAAVTGAVAERSAMAVSDLAAPAASPPAADRQAAAALAAALLDTVHRSELDDAGFRRLEAALAGDSEAPRAAAIGRALDDFDFSTAQDLLRMLVDHLGQSPAHARRTPKTTELT